MSTILKFNNVDAGYDNGRNKVNILNDISFDMQKNEILGLAGESGCGKTTIARAILDIAKVRRGSIERYYNKAQMIFQDPYSSLNPVKTVKWIMHESISLGLKDKTDEYYEQKIYEMCDMVQLGDEILERKPGELSGGQRQRVCIAVSLLQNPDFLIADEPVSALDVTIQAQIMQLLKDVHRKRRLSMIFISHDLRTMYNICDRIIILKDGRIEEIGKPRHMYRHPESEYTKLLLESAGID